jgi:hypothetical protein
MKIELVKESKWETTYNDFKDYYWIRVDGLALDLAYTEADAYIKYNAFKDKYQKKEKEILVTEDLEIEIPSSQFVNLETINK